MWGQKSSGEEGFGSQVTCPNINHYSPGTQGRRRTKEVRMNKARSKDEKNKGRKQMGLGGRKWENKKGK